MARIVTIGNGNMLVGLDERGQVRDFYFPYVGHANHVSGASGSYQHRIGLFVDGALTWLSDPGWRLNVEGCETTGTSHLHYVHDGLGLEFFTTDVVHNEKNIFIRQITLVNTAPKDREIKIFFAQEFRISESRRGDTAFYDPRVHALVHYKGHNAFLVNAFHDDVPFDDYSVGLFNMEGKEGTYTDAEDGTLSKNPIEHGSVDSVLGISISLPAGTQSVVSYWITAGASVQEAHALDAYVRTETPRRIIDSTNRYWNVWMEKESRDLSMVPPEIRSLYNRSLLLIRAHADNRGGIIASSDSDMLNQGRDTYAYVWPRDAAISVNALDRGGYVDAAQRLFSFIANRIERDGYLMHKYRVDGVLGSSWHPWVREGKEELPIQEDETATILFALYKHYELARDVEFIESLYNPFIEPAADFLANYIEPETGLPKSSYDLWEEKYGTSTYTAASVCGGLRAAAGFARVLGKREKAEWYENVARGVEQAIISYLYDIDAGIFVKLVRHEGGSLAYDRTIDMSSFHGVVYFEVLPPFDKRVEASFETLKQTIVVGKDKQGYLRYEDDQYYRTEQNLSNPWCITTLWAAQYHIRRAKSRADLRPALEILEWIAGLANEGGILPEQVHPDTHAHLSASPLVWSHAEFVVTVDEYRKAYAKLS